MLASKSGEGEHKYWPFEKFNSSAQRPSGSRMSSQCLSPLSTQPGWQGHYTCANTEPGAPSSPSPRYPNSSTQAQKSRQGFEWNGEDHSGGAKATGRSFLEDLKIEEAQHDPLRTSKRAIPDGSQEPTRPFLFISTIPKEGCTSDQISAQSPVSTDLRPMLSGQADDEENDEAIKDEDMVVTDEDDTVDSTEDNGTRQQTAAERCAAKRKMKRFRLNHQQTRFLMSEFVKQPHPDATHRERLSQQIPGLTPRQVQVWFQNRRAKIKRLNADDRERVIQMRAVPDNFDNVRALHSPYGAVHGVGRPLTQHELVSQPFRNNNMRSLIVDVQRSVAGTQSPTNLTPSLGGFGFSRSNVTTPDIHSPLSSASNDRFSFGSSSSSPFGVGHGVSNSFLSRQHSFDSATGGSRPTQTLQPLSLRDPLIRSRGETIHSPLQSSMSWKGGSIGYSACQEPSSSSSESRQQSGYLSSTLNHGFYDGGQYVSNPTQGYGIQADSTGDFDIHRDPLDRPKMRAASDTLPLNSEFANQTRSTAVESPSSTQHFTARQIAMSSGMSNSSICTTSYPPAPLTAPMDFSSRSMHKTSPQNSENVQTSI